MNNNNNKIRLKNLIKDIIKEEFAFHHTHGNDFTFEPYKSENKFRCYHETGQFGSGTYFSTYTQPEDKRDYNEKYGDNYNVPNREMVKVHDNLYRVDLDLYKNLYRVRSEKEGDILHTLLSDTNKFYALVDNQAYNYLGVLYQRIKRNSDTLNLKCPPYRELINMANKHINSQDTQSFSTVFMEMNGFNGVNVSGIPKFDNSRHGSVIYDLSKINTNNFQQVKSLPFIHGSGHGNTIASKGLTTFDDAIGKSLIGKFPTNFKELTENDKRRVLKNIYNSGHNVSGDKLLYYVADDKKLLDFCLRKQFTLNNNDIYHDNTLCKLIVNNNATYYINYQPDTYYKESFLVRFIDNYDWTSDSDTQTRKYILNLLNTLNRPLKDFEKTYIKRNFNLDV